MNAIVRCLLLTSAMLTAEAALAQDFKSQAATAAAQWDSALNSGDAAKVAQAYTKTAVILPAGGEQVTGQQGAETLFGGFIKGGVKNHKITVRAVSRKATSAMPMGAGKPMLATKSWAATGRTCWSTRAANGALLYIPGRLINNDTSGRPSWAGFLIFSLLRLRPDL